MEWETGLIGLIVAALIAVIILAAHEEISWQHYAAAHHCMRTGETRADTYIQYIYDGKGNITATIPEETTEYRYKCDDGSLHWH